MVQVMDIDFVTPIAVFILALFFAFGTMVFKRLGKDDLALWFGIFGAISIGSIVIYKIFFVTDYIIETGKTLM